MYNFEVKEELIKGNGFLYHPFSFMRKSKFTFINKIFDLLQIN